MNTDTHFRKGFSHLVCEDYAYSDEKMIIISDGCSTAKDSDLAARILTHACKDCLKKAYETNNLITYLRLQNWIVRSIVNVCNTLSLENLLATLSVRFIDNEYVKVFMYGDGFISYKNKNEDPKVIKVNFIDNDPEYLWYQTMPIMTAGSNIIIDNVEYPRDHMISFAFDKYLLDHISIFSDGVSSFVEVDKDKNKLFKDGLNETEVIKHLTNFKTCNGQFVKRRLNRFLTQAKDNGFIFDDDISMGVMKFGDRE